MKTILNAYYRGARCFSRDGCYYWSRSSPHSDWSGLDNHRCCPFNNFLYHCEAFGVKYPRLFGPSETNIAPWIDLFDQLARQLGELLDDETNSRG